MVLSSILYICEYTIIVIARTKIYPFKINLNPNYNNMKKSISIAAIFLFLEAAYTPRA